MPRPTAEPYVLTMSPLDDFDLPHLPKTAMTREIIDLVTEAENASLANHSFRTYLFARLAANARDLTPGADYDPELLFAACLLHDIGLTDKGDRGQRFEVNGADVAADILSRHGRSRREIDAVWRAIALKTSAGIAERLGTIAELTFAGSAIDFGQDTAFIPDPLAAAVHQAYPRLAIARTLTDAVILHAKRTPDGVPPFSMAAELVRQREDPADLSMLEKLAESSRWGAD
jgi:HD domain